MPGMDINQKLDAILAEHGIIKEVSCDKAVQLLQEVKKRAASGSVIGLYGVGIEAEGLLTFIWEHMPDFRIDYCFDQIVHTFCYKSMIQNDMVSKIDEIKKIHVDYMILGSLTFQQMFRTNLDELGYEGEIVDLYSALEGYIKDHFVDYETVFQTRQNYLKADGEEKVSLLQDMIKEHILLKDFLNTFHYIDLYVENQYPDYSRYEKLKQDLTSLLQEIKGYIKNRSQKDIIINWVDALSYYDIPKFPFLQKKVDEGMRFENAYTVMPWTTEMTRTILFGEYPIEGKLFLRENLSMDQVKMLSFLKANGYMFGYCGMPKFAKLFGQSVAAPVLYYDNKCSGSIQHQWNALNILCQSHTPMCILIHSFRETHPPFICGEGDTFIKFGDTTTDWRQETCKKQAEISGKYMNDQLEFYETFYEDALQIYMSDHGRIDHSPMSENKTHVMLSINGKEIPSGSVDGLFSLIRFSDLVEKIVNNDNDWDSLTDDYAIIQNLDAYSDRIINAVLTGKMSRDEMYQCRGIVTLADKYFKYAYGKEYYFSSRDSQENEIDCPQYQDRIQELRELCGDEFIDIYKYEKFKYSRQLYDNLTTKK